MTILELLHLFFPLLFFNDFLLLAGTIIVVEVGNAGTGRLPTFSARIIPEHGFEK